MATTLRFEGLDELRRALRSLPEDLADEASHIVLNAAQGAKNDIRYPRRTGDLGNHLKVRVLQTGAVSAGAELKNTSKLAWIFEHGSQARHYVTVNGKKHLTGRMPPGHVFVPAVARRRREMYEQLKALLVRAGAVVTGG